MKAPTPKKPKSSNKAPKGAAPVTAKVRHDWEAIERDYRTGKFTLRELEAKHGPSYAEISRRSKREGWTKDLRDIINQATSAAVLRETVTAAQKDVTETVLVAAELNKNVILAHREGLKRITGIKQKLLDQIEQAAENLPELEEVVEILRKPDDNGNDRMNDMMRKAMSRSSLVDDLKKLTEVDERVRKGEREAFGLDDDPADDAPGRGAGREMTDAERAVRLVAILAQGGKK